MPIPSLPKKDLFASSRGKCTKRNPATCRLHGRGVRARIEFMQEAKAAQQAIQDADKLAKIKSLTVKDFEASWKVKQEQDGTTTASVYRSGAIAAPEKRGVESESYSRADSLMPSGRAGRTRGIFAAPSLGGVGRWVRGNHLANNADIKVRELRIDVDTTFVYSISDWEKASAKDTDDVLYISYWNNGISFREYMKLSQKDPVRYDPKKWEILLSPEQIRSIKPVDRERVASQSEDLAQGKILLDYLK